jgi:hypothetical protein
MLGAGGHAVVVVTPFMDEDVHELDGAGGVLVEIDAPPQVQPHQGRTW